MRYHGQTPSYRWRNEGIVPGFKTVRISRRLEGHDRFVSYGANVKKNGFKNHKKDSVWSRFCFISFTVRCVESLSPGSASACQRRRTLVKRCCAQLHKDWALYSYDVSRTALQPGTQI